MFWKFLFLKHSMFGIYIFKLIYKITTEIKWSIKAEECERRKKVYQ